MEIAAFDQHADPHYNADASSGDDEFRQLTDDFGAIADKRATVLLVAT
jgi:hypothetical protein